MDDLLHGGFESSARGAFLTTKHADRTMKTYLILEDELETISMLNTFATLFVSIATTCFGVAATVYFGMDIATSLPAGAGNYLPVIWKLFVAFGVLFSILTFLSFRSKNVSVSRIKQESGGL